MIKKRTKYTDNTATDYYYKITSYVNNQESGLSDPILEDLFCNAYRKSWNFSCSKLFRGGAATYVGQRQILTSCGSGLALPTIKLTNSLTY